jgi:hypothetical protein
MMLDLRMRNHGIHGAHGKGRRWKKGAGGGLELKRKIFNHRFHRYTQMKRM